MFSMKGYLNFKLEMAYITTMQQIYSHETFIVRSCRELAEHNSIEAQRYLLLRSADLAEKRALHYEVKLRLSGVSLPAEIDTLPEIFWRWLFVRLGILCLMKWFEWMQQEDIDQLGILLTVQKHWQ